MSIFANKRPFFELTKIEFYSIILNSTEGIVLPSGRENRKFAPEVPAVRLFFIEKTNGLKKTKGSKKWLNTPTRPELPEPL